MPNIVAVDLVVRVEAGLFVVAVGGEEVRPSSAALSSSLCGTGVTAALCSVICCAPAVPAMAKAAAQIDPSNSDLLRTLDIGISFATFPDSIQDCGLARGNSSKGDLTKTGPSPKPSGSRK